MGKRILVAVFAGYLNLSRLCAGTLNVAVTDIQGAPVRDAVIYAVPLTGTKATSRSHSATIDQINQQFVPYVTAIQVGTAVTFPNHDNIRHHVYSFSPAKKFELPLYAGIPAEPVLFDKEGIVTLGCNIHDWMLAYVVVVGTPYFEITREDGRTTLRSLPAGTYRVQLWQPRMREAADKLAQTVELGSSESKELSFGISLKPDWRSKKTPSLNPEDYR